jgi:hypothetical protein
MRIIKAGSFHAYAGIYFTYCLSLTFAFILPTFKGDGIGGINVAYSNHFNSWILLSLWSPLRYGRVFRNVDKKLSVRLMH